MLQATSVSTRERAARRTARHPCTKGHALDAPRTLALRQSLCSGAGIASEQTFGISMQQFGCLMSVGGTTMEVGRWLSGK